MTTERIPPIPGSSVPPDPHSAIRYAHRLEQSNNALKRRVLAADRRLSCTQALLEEMPQSLARSVALGELIVAREVLGV